MVDILSMVDLTSISAILAAIGVFVGVIFAILQLRDLVKTRQTDLLMRLYSTFGTKEFQEAWFKVREMGEFEDYSDYKRKYGFLETNEVGVFFNGVGVLLHRRLIDINLVDDLFHSVVLRTWEKAKPSIEAARRHFKYPQIFQWFEYLYNEMQKREQQLTQKTA